MDKEKKERKQVIAVPKNYDFGEGLIGQNISDFVLKSQGGTFSHLGTDTRGYPMYRLLCPMNKDDVVTTLVLTTDHEHKVITVIVKTERSPKC